MKTPRACTLALLVLVTMLNSGCSDEFYLTEKEVAAYANVFKTESQANIYFSGLKQQLVTVDFDMVGNTPQVRSSNLLTIMRGTSLGALETSRNQIAIDQLSAQLEKQLSSWAEDRLQVFTGENNAQVRITDVDSASIRFGTDPVFTYKPDQQSIAFDVTINVSINATIEVNALNSVVDFLFSIFGQNVNGTYPLQVNLNSLRLQGVANVLSPFQDAGRVGFQLLPQPGTIDVLDRNNSSVPGKVKDGIRKVLQQALAKPVHEVFDQQYTHFSLSNLRMRPPVGTSPAQLEVTYLSRREIAKPTLHLVARSSTGKLYHARNANGIWTDFKQNVATTKTFNSDPAITSSAGGQLELAATTTTGQLVYTHWRDGAWESPLVAPATPVPVGYRGKPAIVATAPGQIEIVAEGANNGLWHLRRFNGVWQTPVALAAPPTEAGPISSRAPVLVHTGNKLVLFMVSGMNDLRMIAFDLDNQVWGHIAFVPTHGTHLGYDATAVASGDGRVDLVYVDSSGAPYHRPIDVLTGALTVGGAATGLTLLPETAIGGTLNATPVLTASGFRQLDLIGRGLDYKLSYNHFFSPAQSQRVIENRLVSSGWQGWSNMNGCFFGTALPSNDKLGEFAASATATGQVAVAARGNTGELIFHNTFNSTRYGRDPWKTVTWRGFERVSLQKFVGRPALAAVDTNFEMGWVGNTVHPGNTYSSLLAETEPISYESLGLSVRSTPVPIDPVVLSSGPGMVDLIAVSESGKPVHLRRINRDTLIPRILSLPAGVTITSPLAAVSHGAGWIDLVATCSNNSVYHWRYLNGTWTSPTRFAGAFLSGPAIEYVGGETLELFAIGSDQFLYRQSFSGGRWNGWGMINGNFPINQLLFGPQSVASWGDGTVDLVVVSSQNSGLMHRRIGPGAERCPTGMQICPPFPRSFYSIGGTTTETPLLTAIGPSRLNVVTMDVNDGFYNKWGSPPPSPAMFIGDPPIVWSDSRYLGGMGLLIGNSEHSGRENIAVIASDRNGRLFVARFRENHWSSFEPLTGQSPNIMLSPPLFRPVIASHGG